MIRQLSDRLLLVCVACILTFAVLARLDEPPQQLPLIHADYPVCVTVKPVPINPPKHPVLNCNVSEIV